MLGWLFYRRRAGDEDLKPEDEPAPPAPVDEVPAEICTAIDNASVFERDGPDGTGQTIVQLPGFGAFEYTGTEGAAKRIGRARPDMTAEACRKAAKMLAFRCRETQRLRGLQPRPRRRKWVEELFEREYEIW